MRKLYRAAGMLFLLALASPLGLAWLPPGRLLLRLEPDFQSLLHSSFRQLSITLAATLALAMTLTVCLSGWTRASRPCCSPPSGSCPLPLPPPWPWP